MAQIMGMVDLPASKVKLLHQTSEKSFALVIGIKKTNRDDFNKRPEGLNTDAEVFSKALEVCHPRKEVKQDC